MGCPSQDEEDEAEAEGPEGPEGPEGQDGEEGGARDGQGFCRFPWEKSEITMIFHHDYLIGGLEHVFYFSIYWE